ncbi:Uncharacterized protein DAT39_023583, partial [Clarias magur]
PKPRFSECKRSSPRVSVRETLSGFGERSASSSSSASANSCCFSVCSSEDTNG